MSNIKKLMMTAAGGDPLSVEDVFHTQVYTGTNANQQVTNGIDLSTEGGLLWFKSRSNTNSHRMIDTERGLTKSISSHIQAQETIYNSSYPWLTSFNTDGFTIGNQNDTNYNGYEYVGWTFRKAPKFFDVVTYTGNATAGRTISHNLGSVPGMILLKRTDASSGWRVYHRDANGGTNPEQYYAMLQSTNAFAAASTVWNNTAPTSTEFTLGTDTDSNTNGATYVAYLFAHNDDDGGFGPDQDKDIIKCGSYQSDGNASEISVDLGFEPQFVMAKAISTTGNWHVQDTMRGMAVDSSNNPYLQWNTSDSESADGTAGCIVPTSNGFRVGLIGDINIFNAEQTYIYMAIRRGPMAVPESASDVFALDLSPNSNNPRFISGFPIDMAMQRSRSSSGVEGMDITSRLSEDTFLRTGHTYSDNSTSTMNFDFMNGYDNDGDSSDNFIAQMWKRAPTFFDVVCYTGTGSARTVTHNLEAIPEMIWVKNRDQTISWSVYHASLGNTKQVSLNASTTPATGSSYWNNTTPTSSVFTVGTAGATNSNTRSYIAFLFCSLDGIAKVGSYTGNGSNQNIECGFSNGAKLIIIKDISSAQDWYIFDAERGIVSGNDPALRLNVEYAEITNADAVDPYSGGFNVVQNGNAETNANGNTYIFYAVAA